MKTQLWMWKYNGQDEVGIKSAVDKQELFRTDDFYSLATQHSRRTIGQVTNLRPAKVVDADAVVIDRKDYNQQRFYQVMEVFAGIKFGNPFEHEVANDIVQKLLGISYKPVTEPTGFGAIVEAGFRFTDGDNRQKWVSSPTFQRTLVWHSENCAMQPWENLINPVVISEGVRN